MLYSYSYFSDKKKKRQSLKCDASPLAAVTRRQASRTSSRITQKNGHGVLGRPWSSAHTHTHTPSILIFQTNTIAKFCINLIYIL